MRKRKYATPLLVLSVASLVTYLGFSSWNLNSSKIKDFDINIDISKDKVAYFKDGNTKREFTTVAGALKAAADRKQEILVVVNPDTTGNVSITDCTIADKVTLIINYKAVENYKSPSSKDFVKDYTGDKDGGSFGDTAGSKSKIKLSGARKIESGGSLIIGGETGQNSTPMQGGTRGSCAELNFVEGGSIDCYGKIISYGFIHDYLEGTRGENEAAITIHDGGSVAEPLTIYTWPGGNSAKRLNDKNLFPCNVFDLTNIRPPRKFEYGSVFTGTGKVYTSGLGGLFAGYYSAEASIIAKDSQDGFLQLQNGKDTNHGTGISGSVLFDANDTDKTKTGTVYNSHKTKIKTSGDFSFSGVSVTVGRSLDTKKGYLPISGIFDIEVGKGFGEIKYATKILPGAKLKIKEGAYFKLDGNFIAYQSPINNGGYQRRSYSFTSPAIIQNDGTIDILSGFDGKIDAISNKGKVIAESGYTNVSGCQEIDTTGSIGGMSGKEHYSSFEFYKGAYRSRLAERYSITGTTSYIIKGDENGVANRTYTSSAASDGKYGWTYNNEYKSYPIVIDTNGNDSAVDSNGQKYIENYGSGTTLSNLTSKDPDKTFDGFYYDQACTKALGKNESGLYYVNPDRLRNYLTNNCLKVYAKWISGYTVHFKYRKYSTDHLSKYTEIDSSTIIKKADLGDTYTLNPNNDIKLSPDYYFEYNGNNSSIPANQFNCYYDVVSSIQVVHRSSDGTSTTTNITSDNISNLSSWPTSDWVTGDTIEVVVSYKTTRKQSDITINAPETIGAGKSGIATIKNFDKTWFADRNIAVSIQWSYKAPDKIAIEDQGDSLKITNNNSGENTQQFKVQLAAKFGKSPIGNAEATIYYIEGTCVSFDTLVLMADGTYKKAGDIEIGDQVLAFNHYTGKVVPAVIAFNDIYKVDDYNIIHLVFSNGKTIKISSEHGFFDVDLKRYVYITETNYQNFIGHHFLEISNNTKRRVTLTDAYARIEHIGVCSPGTSKYFNIITNDRLSIAGGLPGLFNYFDLDDDFTINREKMEKDIKRYGLFDYSHYSSYRSREAFDAFNIKYLKISRGKGLITEEEFIALLTRYARFVH